MNAYTHQFSALRKRISVRWTGNKAQMTLRKVGMIGGIETKGGKNSWVWIDPKYRGMGLGTKMYGEAMRQAPKGRLASDNAVLEGGEAIWNKLARSKGYRVRENASWPADGGIVAVKEKRPIFVGRITPKAVREFSELTPLAKSVWRHYYGKLKKQTRGGKLSKSLAGYLPDDGQASKSGLLWRGTNKAEIESLASRKRFKSKWTNANYPDRPRTYVAGSPHKASSYALVSGGDRPPRAANWKDFKKHLVQSTKDARIYGISKTAYRRADNDVRSMVGDFAATAPLKGGIKASEVRALLKPSGVVREPIYGSRAVPRYRWKPVPLGEIQKKQFSRIDRGRVEMSRENLAKQRRRDPIGREAGIPLTGQIAHDRYVIENRRKDVAKRDSNILRAGIAGTAAGAVLGRGRLPLKARLAAGALAGAGSVIGVRAATQKTGRDVYGARHPWAARSEAAPAVIGAGAAGYGAYRILRKKFFKMSDARFEFAKKEKRQMNPYVMAGLSGAVSGAALGFLPLLRRGTTLKTALKTAVGGAAAGGAVVGGGSLLGSKILGDPNNKEGAAFTKRAAVGGALVGGTLGVAGGLVARRVPLVNRHIGNLAKEWRPAHMIQKSGSLKAAAIGGVAGAGYGLAQGADEGQQVDSIRNIRKDLKRMHGLSAVEFSENVIIKQKRDTLSKVRDAAQLAASLGVLGLAGYAGLRTHNLYKIARRKIPQVATAIEKEAPGVARYTKATLRSIRKASSQVSQTSRDIPAKIDRIGTVIDDGMLGSGGFRAAFRKKKELSAIMFEQEKKRNLAATAVLTGAGLAGATAGTIIGLRGGRAVVRAVKRNEKAARQQAVRIEKAIKGTVRSVGTVAGRASQTQQALQNSTRVYADVGKVYREAKGGLYNVLHPINTLRETRRAFRAGLKGRDYYRTKTRPEWAMEAGVSHVELEKPFHGYNKKRHAKTGGLNEGVRKKYNIEHGSNLKRPVTTEPSKLKPGSKAAKRRASFCARMGGMQGPTSKEGQLTPKGAALKRWN